MHIFDGQFTFAAAVVPSAGIVDGTYGNNLFHATFAGIKAGAEAFWALVYGAVFHFVAAVPVVDVDHLAHGGLAVL